MSTIIIFVAVLMTAVSATKAVLEKFPAVKDLPVRKEMPEAMTMDGGTKVTTVATEDVMISHCTLADSIFACFSIGSETSGGIRDVRIEDCTFTRARTYAIYIKSRPGRGAFIENISATNLDVATTPGGFLRVNLLNSGIQDPEPVPDDEEIPVAKNYRFSDVKVDCGTLVDAASISPMKPVDGFSLANISGTCRKAIALANLTHVELRDIHVTGYEGPFLTQTNVQGAGLEEIKN